MEQQKVAKARTANITGVEHRLAVTFDQEHHCTSTVVRAEEGDSDRQ
jgi:hypothetical protein